ncbi:MAG: ATP-binding protein, partial [Bacteroidota bacterium]
QLLYREYGEIYEQIEDYEKAQEYYLKLLEYTKEKNLVADQNIAYYYLVGVARSLGDPIAYSNYLNEYLKMRGELTRETLEGKYHSGLLLLGNDSLEQAIPTLRANLKTHLSLEHYHPAISTLFILAKAYDKTGNHQAALDALEQQISLSEGFANVSAMVLSYQDAYKQAEILEDWEKASYYLNQFTTLRNEIYRSEQRDRMEELAVAFEAEKQEQTIRIQALELQKKTNQRNFFIASSLLLLFLAIVIFVGARQIMQTRKQLALQKAQIQEQDIQHLTRQKKLTEIKAMAKGQEIERLRVAKDLQDNLGILLSQVDRSFDQILPGKNTHSDLANKTRGFLTEAQKEMHRIAQDLHPEILINHGLKGALNALGEQIKARGLQVDMQLDQLTESEDPAKSASVYRIIQEIVHNAIKHAEADRLRIHTQSVDDQLKLKVSDDGKGMLNQSEGPARGIGMQNIQSRMDFLNGQWDLQAKPGQGTTYTLVIPHWTVLNPEILESYE